jgi:hypothetical protein
MILQEDIPLNLNCSPRRPEGFAESTLAAQILGAPA